VSGGVVALLNAVVGTGDHCVADDGHRSNRSVALIQRNLGLSQRLSHEELVVHGWIIQARRHRIGLTARRARIHQRPGPG